MYQRILCPVDGSETSNCGMHEAIKLAKALNAQLRFLHVIDLYLPMTEISGEVRTVCIGDILRKHGHKVLDYAQEMAASAGVQAETKTIETIAKRVSKIVLDEVKTWPADLIVMGTHGLRGVERIVMGSDAETILRKSPVPVLLAKKPTPTGQ